MLKKIFIVLTGLLLITAPVLAQETENQTAPDNPETTFNTGTDQKIEALPEDETADKTEVYPEDEPVITAEDSSVIGEYFPVEGLNQWQYQYDISSLDEGIYNLIVRGIDTAGNEVDSTAVDIFIDPDSDLPKASLTYPSRNMRISGDLNILGSARDDDGVSYVEFSLDDGEFTRVTGAEFWSYDLSTGEFPDGNYKLTVRSTDINGLTGPEAVTKFYIDRKVPVISITSHESGDLVSGKITIEGSVEDSNGVEELLFSTDGGTTFLPSRLSGEYKEGSGIFSLSINTKELADGPGIIWLEGRDSLGSTGMAALLLYIDNQAPKLDFLYPDMNTPVNGSFSVMGRAFDEVGLASLEYSAPGAEESTVIPMEPGNPYWKVDVDFTGEKKAELVFILKDTAGNTEKYPLKLDLDWTGDLPLVELYTPEDGSFTNSKVFQGVIIDDDGPGGIIYSLDKGEEITVDSGRFFNISLEELSAGEHTLAYRGKDVNGIEGENGSVSFSILPGPPEISIRAFRYAEGRENPFSSGAAVRPDEITGISGSVFFDSGKGTAGILLSGGEKQDLSLKKGEEPGVWHFTADFPEPLAYGFFEIEISAEDDMGAVSVLQDNFWIENHGRNLEAHGFYQPEGDYSVDSDRAVVLRYAGYPLSELTVAEEAGFLKVEEKDGFITITGEEPGALDNLKLTGISDRGVEFVSDNIRITSDMESPVILEVQPESGSYQGRLNISGEVSDDSGRPDFFYRIGSGEFQSLNLKEGDNGYTFSFTPDAELFTDGGNVLTLLARDSAGRETVVRRAYQIPQTGEEPPPVKLYSVSPLKDDVVFPERQNGGELLISAGITGLESVTGVTWSLDGGEPRAIDGFPVASIMIPVPDAGSHTVSFRAEYGEGKSLSSSSRFTVLSEPGTLSLESVEAGEESEPFVPGGDIVVKTGGTIAGRVTGTGKYPAASTVIDGGEPVTLRLSSTEDGSVFRIPLKDLSFGRHDIRIEMEDSHGRKILENFFFFAVDDMTGRTVEDNEGLYPLTLPSDDKVYFMDPGSGISFYFNGREIESAALSSPSENFPVSVAGSLVTLKADGVEILREETLEVTTIDGDSFSWGPFDISSDTTPPELTLASPEYGGYYRDSIIISGHLADDLESEGIEFSLQGQPFREFESEPVELSGEEPAGSDGTDAEAEVSAENEESQPEEETGIQESSDPRMYDFSGEVDLSGISDGPVELVLRFRDKAGNSSEHQLYFIKDASPPVVTQILPEVNESVNGRFSFMFRGEDEWTEGFEGGYSLNGELLESYEGEDSFFVKMDLSAFEEVPGLVLSLKDTAGNTGELEPGLLFQPLGDLPSVQIQIPEENALITSDFEVSGVILDDDGVEKIEYRLDDGEFISMDGGNSFSIPVSISGLTDNEHRMEIRAFDLWGVESETITLNFRVSLDVPRAEMTEPVIGRSNRGVIRLKGTAADANGIGAVYLSLDNGNSFHRAEGGEEWSYELETRVLVDGNYMVQIRVEDSYGVSALYSSLLTIDNTPPKVQLSSPLDGMGVSGDLALQMRLSDEIGVEALKYTVRPLGAVEGEDESEADPEKLIQEGELVINEVVIDSLNLAGLLPGRYNLSIFAYDDAGNETVVSRNILRKDPSVKSVPRILFPFYGTEIHGPFVLEGRIEGDYYPPAVTLLKNGAPFDILETVSGGYFYRQINPEDLEDGEVDFQVVIQDTEKNDISSSVVKLDYSGTGPWVRIDSVRTGEYVSNRPWIEGAAGFLFTPPEEGEEEPKEVRKGREIEQIEYSLDNGRSFFSFKVRDEWKFRLETQTLQDGDLGILVRVSFKNGEKAVTQLHVIVDDTPPSVAIMTPEEGLSFNETLSLNGIAFDESGLSDVSVMLRKGSKNSYEIPSFIQGLYIDSHFLGATYWEVGAGLTFFDDNVKIQALFGMAPHGRFDGTVFGVKLLANVATIPYGYFFGPDWDFLSSSFAVGSAFEYFSMSGDNEEESGLVLGAFVVQIELVKVKFRNLKFFNTYSLYAEDQLWFVSSDVEGGILNKIAFGLRVNVF